MEPTDLQPHATNGHGPTCFAALSVMADAAKLDVSGAQLRAALKMACIPGDAEAQEWGDVLERVLSLVTHPAGDYHYVKE